jgi:hypothetical protein
MSRERLSKTGLLKRRRSPPTPPAMGMMVHRVQPIVVVLLTQDAVLTTHVDSFSPPSSSLLRVVSIGLPWTRRIRRIQEA